MAAPGDLRRAVTPEFPYALVQLVLLADQLALELLELTAAIANQLELGRDVAECLIEDAAAHGDILGPVPTPGAGSARAASASSSFESCSSESPSRSRSRTISLTRSTSAAV